MTTLLRAAPLETPGRFPVRGEKRWGTIAAMPIPTMLEPITAPMTVLVARPMAKAVPVASPPQRSMLS